MLAAQNQADQYVRALPGPEGRPPFIVVTDVGRSLELYSEFTRSGGTYVPFPDPAHHRVTLEDLREPEIQRRLRLLWLDPESLDPSKVAAKVTRQVSAKLAELARALEGRGYTPDRVAHFLKRCLFTMFSEDVELLPRDSFTTLLEHLKDKPDAFVAALDQFWQTMNTGGFDSRTMEKIRHFNGGLFRDIQPIPLGAEEIGLLLDAAKADWRYVEPAIFGTLLERALDPRERHKLGAHYTPRAYVERLVMPTIVEPLRAEWQTVQVAAAAWLEKGKRDKAINELKEFHYRLCQIRVLDPACGSGNFLYVSLEHLKRLEGEVLNVVAELSGGQAMLEAEGLAVDPHQFLGLEINPRAAAIAEVVLWIGYLQWHYRLRQVLDIPEPIIRDFHNIEHRDALIEYDNVTPLTDGDGVPTTIWDGVSYAKSPVTGEPVPDEDKRRPIYKYLHPRSAPWPEADFIVGNPPFIGEKRMRDVLGDGYVDAVREVYSDLPACDFVMYWWHKAAELVADGKARRFGFITTNSITQSKNRAVVAPHCERGMSLVFAVPDHPWVDAADGAAVRIAMTVARQGAHKGQLWRVATERDAGGEAKEVEFDVRRGRIFADLTVGAPLMDAAGLASNSGLVFQGVKLVGEGFLVDAQKREAWLHQNPQWIRFLPRLVAGKDLTNRREPRYCIDFFGLTAEQAQRQFPAGYQQVIEQVKPYRQEVKRKAHRERFWIYGEARPGMRAAVAGLDRYIVTSEVSKHRYFVMLDSKECLADGSLAVVALNDPFFLGCLSSRVHVRWALAQGGRLESRPRWQNGPCFLNFPFPLEGEADVGRIRDLGEQIDSHRKQQQERYAQLTITDVYNVLEKLNAGEALNNKERTVHEQGVVSVLKDLHDELDRAVFRAYGWDDLAERLVGCPGATTPYRDRSQEQAEAEEELLSRLVALNAERVAEEARGHVRWLRPDFQASTATQGALEEQGRGSAAIEPTTEEKEKPAWPKTMPEQVEAVCEMLAAGPQAAEALSAQFKRKPIKSVEQVLSALHVLGKAHLEEGLWRLG